MRAILALCLTWLVWALPACKDHSLPNATLTFARHGQTVRTWSFSEMGRHVSPETIETQDPYYGTRKRFRALELEPLLVAAFGTSATALRRQSFILRALDGYAVPIEGTRLLEGGAYVAFDDIDVAGFAPIGPQQVSPAPAYLVWTRANQGNPETHPRPWQLATIEIARFEQLYPHTVPRGEAPGSAAQQGFLLFRERCIRCHAINREGGRVGPDLNVPQSIVEYRPESQIRAFIRDPSVFRYGAMPAHPDLSEEHLASLIAYFQAMAKQKHDPDGQRKP